MKNHIISNITKGKERNLKAFSAAMFQLISKRPFDAITVSEICETGSFPRATFYNYFYDKYDLLNHCWQVMTEEIDIESYEHTPSEEVLLNAFDQLYTLFKENDGYVKSVLKYNAFDSVLVSSFSEYLKHAIKDKFNQCLNKEETAMPVELLSTHYSNTILLMLEWIFITGNDLTMKEAHLYLKHLLNSNEQETA